jgi:hypothetical protein
LTHGIARAAQQPPAANALRACASLGAFAARQAKLTAKSVPALPDLPWVLSARAFTPL